MSRKRAALSCRVIALKFPAQSFTKRNFFKCPVPTARPIGENYEQKGQDYPIGFVRWTEKRNFEAILAAIENGQLDVEPLITERVPLAEYKRIYGNIGQSSSIASILVYENTVDRSPVVTIANRSFTKGQGVIGIIGAGNFTSATLLPALKPLDVQLKYIVSAGGLNASTLAKRRVLPALRLTTGRCCPTAR